MRVEVNRFLRVALSGRGWAPGSRLPDVESDSGLPQSKEGLSPGICGASLVRLPFSWQIRARNGRLVCHAFVVVFSGNAESVLPL